MGRVLELGPGRQTQHLDHAGITHAVLHAESVAHRAGDDLQLGLILGGKSDQHDEEVTSRPIKSAKVTNQP